MKNSEIGDERLIQKLSPIRNALKNILNINGYKYKFDTSKIKDYRIYYGLIAQEIEKEYSYIVKDTLKVSNFDNVLYKTIDYNQTIPILVEAIKDLNNKIDKLQEEIKNNNNGK